MKVARDEKTRLVRAACAVSGLTPRELAENLGVDRARLSPSGRFAKADRDRLMATMREMAGDAAPPAPKRGREGSS